MLKFILMAALALITFSPPSFAQIVRQPCVPTPSNLCLNNNRFQVKVDWRDEASNPFTVPELNIAGRGRAAGISDSWGSFWFFDPSNTELLVHVFAGCQNNNHFWVFAAGLTNVEYNLTVTDTQTGQVKDFFNPLGSPFEPITDTSAFATCPFAAKAPAPKRESVSSAREVESAKDKANCVASATSACLREGRFEVFVDTLGTRSPARMLADGTAGFPFTNPTFFDLFVTINDGSTVNDRFWVTYSMFYPSNFRLTVIDHKTGTTKVYNHTAANPRRVQDRQAFAGDQVPVIDGSLSGSWYSPARSGEGFIFDVSRIGGVPTLLLYYFTYENNTSGYQAWVVGAAPIIGNAASVPVVITDGARFGAGMRPQDVKRNDWGNVKVTFLDCNNARIESSSTTFPSVKYNVVRLTSPPTGVGGVCASNAAIPAGTTINGGHSGSWYTTVRDGEGFIFDISVIGGVNTLVVYYFTYENNASGRQAFLVGAAPIVGNSADVPMVITSGTSFGASFDPNRVVRTPWGNVRVTWQTCNLANVVVTSPLFSNVSFAVNRLTPPPIGATGMCG